MFLSTSATTRAKCALLLRHNCPTRSQIIPQATVSYTVTCFPSTSEASSQPAVSFVANGLPPPPAATAPTPNPSVAPPAPPIPREQFLAGASHHRSEISVGSEVDANVAVPPTASSASISVSASQAAPAFDGASIRPTAPVVKPSAPKSAAKLTEYQDRLDASHLQLRKFDVTAHDLHNLQLDEIRSFDRESLVDLSALLLSRQNTSSSSASRSALDSEPSSSSTDLSKENARLQAAVDILKVRALSVSPLNLLQQIAKIQLLTRLQGRVAAESGTGLGYDSVSYLQTELISAMVI